MNIEKVREDAPPKADFYVRDNGYILYISCCGGGWFLWNGNGWERLTSSRIMYFRDSLRRLYNY